MSIPKAAVNSRTRFPPPPNLKFSVLSSQFSIPAASLQPHKKLKPQLRKSENFSTQNLSTSIPNYKTIFPAPHFPSASLTITGSSVVIPSTPSAANFFTSAGLFTVHT